MLLRTASKAYNWYMSCLKRRPLVTQALSAGKTLIYIYRHFCERLMVVIMKVFFRNFMYLFFLVENGASCDWGKPFKKVAPRHYCWAESRYKWVSNKLFIVSRSRYCLKNKISRRPFRIIDPENKRTPVCGFSRRKPTSYVFFCQSIGKLMVASYLVCCSILLWTQPLEAQSTVTADWYCTICMIQVLES